MMEEEDELDREDGGDSDCESYENNDGFGFVDDSKYAAADREDFDYYDELDDDTAFDNDYEQDYAQNDDQQNEDYDNDDADI